MISAINNPRLGHFSFLERVIDADRFIVFLKDLIREVQRKVFLIVNSLRVHRSNRVRAWTAENTEKIEPFCLPTYAPELNPAEFLNLHLNLKTAKRSGPIAKTTVSLLEKRVRAWNPLLRSRIACDRTSALVRLEPKPS